MVSPMCSNKIIKWITKQNKTDKPVNIVRKGNQAGRSVNIKILQRENM